MKQHIIVIIALGFALNARGELNDFSAMIAESSNAQIELHGQIKEHVGVKGAVANEVRKPQVFVDTKVTYNSPTNKAFLTFEKEKINSKLAEEVDPAE